MYNRLLDLKRKFHWPRYIENSSDLASAGLPEPNQASSLPQLSSSKVTDKSPNNLLTKEKNDLPNQILFQSAISAITEHNIEMNKHGINTPLSIKLSDPLNIRLKIPRTQVEKNRSREYHRNPIGMVYSLVLSPYRCLKKGRQSIPKQLALNRAFKVEHSESLNNDSQDEKNNLNMSTNFNSFNSNLASKSQGKVTAKNSVINSVKWVQTMNNSQGEQNEVIQKQNLNSSVLNTDKNIQSSYSLNSQTIGGLYNQDDVHISEPIIRKKPPIPIYLRTIKANSVAVIDIKTNSMKNTNCFMARNESNAKKGLLKKTSDVKSQLSSYHGEEKSDTLITKSVSKNSPMSTKLKKGKIKEIPEVELTPEEIKNRQRKEIYALNKVMTAWENEMFGKFSKENKLTARIPNHLRKGTLAPTELTKILFYNSKEAIG